MIECLTLHGGFPRASFGPRERHAFYTYFPIYTYCHLRSSHEPAGDLGAQTTYPAWGPGPTSPDGLTQLRGHVLFRQLRRSRGSVLFYNSSRQPVTLEAIGWNCKVQMGNRCGTWRARYRALDS
jgi:hypothetical protein